MDDEGNYRIRCCTLVIAVNIIAVIGVHASHRDKYQKKEESVCQKLYPKVLYSMYRRIRLVGQLTSFLPSRTLLFGFDVEDRKPTCALPCPSII